jgi:hypothetical protein
MAVGAIVDFLSGDDFYWLTPDPRTKLNEEEQWITIERQEQN